VLPWLTHSGLGLWLLMMSDTPQPPPKRKRGRPPAPPKLPKPPKVLDQGIRARKQRLVRQNHNRRIHEKAMRILALEAENSELRIENSVLKAHIRTLEAHCGIPVEHSTVIVSSDDDE